MADPRANRARFDPSEGREEASRFSIEESARRVGHYRWIEMRLFEVLGGWVATVPELDAKAMLGRHCYHHAWHAELWHQGFPELRELHPDRLTVAPGPALEAFVAALAQPEGENLTIEKLTGVYRVLLPRKIAAYHYHRGAASTITDGPAIRSLGFILSDELTDWREGEMLLQSLITTADEVGRAARRQAELETLMLDAGGIAGPGSAGDQPRPV